MIRTISGKHLPERFLSYSGTSEEKIINQEIVKQKRQEARRLQPDEEGGIQTKAVYTVHI